MHPAWLERHTFRRAGQAFPGRQARPYEMGCGQNCSEFFQAAWENAAKRIRSWTGYQEAHSDQQDREGEFHAAFTDVKAVGQVNEIDGANHDDDDADGADALHSAEKNSQATGKLSQPDQIANDDGSMRIFGEILRPRAAESAK